MEDHLKDLNRFILENETDGHGLEFFYLFTSLKVYFFSP